MKSIINAQPPCLSIFSRRSDLKLKPHLISSKPLGLSNTNRSFSRGEAVSSGFLLHVNHKRHTRLHLLPIRVGSAALFLAATTAPKSADISVLLPTSAVMLFAFWIANFVLPDFVLKDLQARQTNEDGNDADEEENSP